MKIVFHKVGSTAKPFEIESKGAVLKGTLQKSGYHRVDLNAELSGIIELNCDRCSEIIHRNLDNQLQLKLSDEVIQDKDDLDIIEFLDGVIDISYILEGEINVLKNAYHYCDKCNNSDKDFEVEF
ncbi:MAG: hypothetical protein U9Q90_04680 [Campylobacterota bacterium]|nr:hypothetical protein [Campylobacterota bacterium]